MMIEDGQMRVALDVGLSLHGGSVLLQIGEEMAGRKLKDMAMELIESREGQGSQIADADLQALADVSHELQMVADLIDHRVELERERARAREA